jgi:DNA processing protein
MTGNGGLLKEFISYTQPDREHFPMRNRIIAGMCDALVVVETARRGGSMISAEIANSYDKDVFAVPGRVSDRQSEGCLHLIKSHKAALIESAADVAYAMRWDEPAVRAPVQTELFVELTEEEKIVVNLLRGNDVVSIDRLIAEAHFSHSTAASLLLALEFKGLVRSLPGKRYALLNHTAI